MKSRMFHLFLSRRLVVVLRMQFEYAPLSIDIDFVKDIFVEIEVFVVA